MALFTKYWSQLTAMVGISFFAGGFVQNTAISAGVAVDRAAIVQVQADQKALVELAKQHDKNITDLIIITQHQSDQIDNILKHGYKRGQQ